MDQKATERLKDFLAQLPPRSQAMLMREFERAVESGRDVAVANFVLQLLRALVRSDPENVRSRTDEAARQAMRVLLPFLVDGNSAGIGEIKRDAIGRVWQWLVDQGVPEQAKALEIAIAAGNGAANDNAIFAFHAAVSEAIAQATSPAAQHDNHRTLGQIGPVSVVEALMSVGAVFGVSQSLAGFSDRMLKTMRVFGDAEIARTIEALDDPALQTPQFMPFALRLVKQRLGVPWQLIRLAIKTAGSDDEFRVASSIYGCAVSIVIEDLAKVASTVRADIKRARFDDLSHHLKAVYEGIRGLRTELDIRSDSNWGRQLAAIRIEVSSALQSEIESVPGRVRRLLRQRPDKDVTATSRIDPIEVDETVALVDLVATCRNFAGELAINEVTLRTFSELQQYVERSTEALVASLKSPDPKVRHFRKQQVDAAVRFCEVLFGFDYAALMSKAADNALIVERKPVSRAG